MPAAKASYCAGQQGPELFWQMHDWLFANQNTWGSAQDAADQFRKQALAIGVDGAKYDACLQNAATAARIQKDLADGAALGIQGTPAFYVNDWFLSGAYPFEEFEDRIEKAQNGVHPAPTPTPLPQGVEFFDADPARPGFTYDGSPSLGAAEANLTLIAFEDFKSTDAAQHAGTVEPTLKSKYIDTNQMRLVVKPFPDTAPRAGVAALCAARQGKFWEFRSLLYQKQAEWQEGDDPAMSAYAKSLGLDQSAFDLCLKDAGVQAEIDNALEFGQTQIGVPQVPAFLLIKRTATGEVEGVKPLVGLQTIDVFEQTIKDLTTPKPPTATPPPAVSEATLASLPVGVDADGHFYRGDPDAAVKLEDFTDFQCPFCARHATQTEPLLYEAYIATGQVLHVFRNFPIPSLGHANAIPAASAAYCAGQQDAKFFWAMHDWLFANQSTWTDAQDAAAQFRKQALEIGANAGSYDACLKDAKTEAAIQADMTEGSTRGVNGTPSFFLSGQGAASPTPIVGAQAYAQFAQAIDALLASQ